MSNPQDELSRWQGLVARLHDLQNSPEADADEIEALRREVGIFAKAPKDGWLALLDGKVVYRDVFEGDRYRDGSWANRKQRPFQ